MFKVVEYLVEKLEEYGEELPENVLMELDELHADGRVTEEEYMNMREKLGVKT